MAAAIIDMKKKSVFNYHRVLLFNHDVQAKQPFCSYNRSMFSEYDIPNTWFRGPLTPANRRQVLRLDPLGGGRFSVFCKIEIGMSIFVVPTEHLIKTIKNFCNFGSAYHIVKTLVQHITCILLL